ncbi:MAG TPA: M28 family metallopeptidase [Thermoanaerobaculia bacterium]|nr:M28 family metallopeptidase [Thermoanaerobaculia bacterium]
MRSLVCGLLMGALLAVTAAQAQEPLAHRVASDLARLGPRPDGAPSQQKAARLLLDAMKRVGLQGVRAVPVAGNPGWVNLTGVLPGKSSREIVLSAHYDTVPPSPGAGDDASGCGVVIAAAADLARTPLDHTVRVVLFDAEETGLKGSRGWVAALPPAQRERILANLNVEMVGWAGSAGPTIHSFPVQFRGERTLAPGWLVHSLLRSGEAVGVRYEMSDTRFPMLAQLILRTARLKLGADADAFLAQGIPALSVSDSALLTMDPAFHRPTDTVDRLDSSRLGRWTEAVAAAVRRMDRLAGRPISEDEYLVFFDRVWMRRDIYWMGMALWVFLLFRGRPGRWSFRSREESVREGWRYAPGFAFRWLFLLAFFLAPVLALLLFPAALLAAFPPRRTWARLLLVLAGLLPLLIYAATLTIAFLGGMASRKAGFLGGWPAAVLIPGAAVAFVFLMMTFRGGASSPPTPRHLEDTRSPDAVS